MSPNADDSRLADDLSKADVVILSRVWDEFHEPNDSRELGSDRPNRVLRRRFCTVLDLPLYELLERCDRAGSVRRAAAPRKPLSRLAEPMRTLVVVPTYLEVMNIEEALTRSRPHVPDVDILVVDDSSPDGTAALAKRVAGRARAIDVLERPKKTGLGAAYRDGFAVGIERGYEVLVQMDADLSHDAAALPSLLAEVDAGADLVIGSRYIPGGSVPHWPWHRRSPVALGQWLLRLHARVRRARHDVGLSRGTAVRRWKPSTTRAPAWSATASRSSSRTASRVGAVDIEEVPIEFTDRVPRGHSKMSPSVAFEELWLVTWWSIRDRPWLDVDGASQRLHRRPYQLRHAAAEEGEQRVAEEAGRTERDHRALELTPATSTIAIAMTNGKVLSP